MTVCNDVVELPAAAAFAAVLLTSLATVAVADAVNAVTAAVEVIAVRVYMSVASADVGPASVCETQGNSVTSRPGCM